MTSDNQLFSFCDEKTELKQHISTNNVIWKLLCVEDDRDYLDSLVSTLGAIEIPVGIELEILTANSAREAIIVFNKHPDIGLILLDVVMETDDAGLQFVNYVRQHKDNHAKRIVLLTGQPGFAPLKEVMTNYNIDEYWNKVDISIDKLQSLVTSNFRTWQMISEINEAREGLGRVVNAARTINQTFNLATFINTVLDEIVNITGIGVGGVICFAKKRFSMNSIEVISTSSFFTEFNSQKLDMSVFDNIRSSVINAFKAKTHIIGNKQSLLFFETNSVKHQEYVIYIQSEKALTQTDISLLSVFCENINSGFNSISLLDRVNQLAFNHIEFNIPNLNWIQSKLEALDEQQLQNMRLLMIEIHNLDEMKFVFGFSFIKNTFILAFKELQKLLPEHSYIAMTGPYHFSALVNQDFEITKELIQAITRNNIEVSGVKHLIPTTLISIDLENIKRHSLHYVFNLGEGLLKKARSQHHSYLAFTPEQKVELDYRYQLLTELRQAILNKSFTIALQPKIELATGDLAGFEALARWTKQDGSTVAPELFVKIAESSGLIGELDCIIAEKSIDAIATLQNLGFNYPIAINVSAFDLIHVGYLERLFHFLAKRIVSPSMIELEITETEAMTNYSLIQSEIQKCSDVGIKITIDDFGTGYSSLDRITQLIVDSIKIDKSFVDRISDNGISQNLIIMILDLSKKMGLKVVAEGIETESQRIWLTEAGCDIGQGYLFAHPMSLDESIKWIFDHQSNHSH